LSLNARSYQFDAGVLLLFYSGMSSVKPYFDRVFNKRASGFVSEVNLAEFYYKTIEKFGLDTAEVWYLQIRQSNLKIIAPDIEITRKAGLWKSKNKGISLADCFALATLQENAQVLLTTDAALTEISGIKAVYLSPN
jgi:predicted nucleic acid-binding protein